MHTVFRGIEQTTTIQRFPDGVMVEIVNFEEQHDPLMEKGSGSTSAIAASNAKCNANKKVRHMMRIEKKARGEVWAKHFAMCATKKKHAPPQNKTRSSNNTALVQDHKDYVEMMLPSENKKSGKKRSAQVSVNASRHTSKRTKKHIFDIPYRASLRKGAAGSRDQVLAQRISILPKEEAFTIVVPQYNDNSNCVSEDDACSDITMESPKRSWACLACLLPSRPRFAQLDEDEPYAAAPPHFD